MPLVCVQCVQQIAELGLEFCRSIDYFLAPCISSVPARTCQSFVRDRSILISWYIRIVFPFSFRIRRQWNCIRLPCINHAWNRSIAFCELLQKFKQVLSFLKKKKKEEDEIEGGACLFQAYVYTVCACKTVILPSFRVVCTWHKHFCLASKTSLDGGHDRIDQAGGRAKILPISPQPVQFSGQYHKVASYQSQSHVTHTSPLFFE